MSDCPHKLYALPYGIHAGLGTLGPGFDVEHKRVGSSPCPTCGEPISYYEPSGKGIVSVDRLAKLEAVLEAAKRREQWSEYTACNCVVGQSCPDCKLSEAIKAAEEP